jgi:molecular chaperone DnaJ
MEKDYYEILGVPKDATQAQIRDAYRRLVLKHHPDVNKDPKAQAKMQELNEAYAVLNDEQKRAQYDSFGPDQFGQRFSEEDIFRGFNTDDILKNIFGPGFSQFGDTFSQGAQNAQPQGMNIYFPFEDLERGIDREFAVQHYEVCHNCRGSGGEPGAKQLKCPSCNGSGRKRVQQNTIFGSFQMVATCNRCKGKGRVYEKECRICHGNGQVVVTDRFRIRAERADKPDKTEKGGASKGKRFGMF